MGISTLTVAPPKGITICISHTRKLVCELLKSLSRKVRIWTRAPSPTNRIPLLLYPELSHLPDFFIVFLSSAYYTLRAVLLLEIKSDSLNKEGHSDICHNIHEPWGHYAKWTKPVTKNKYCTIHLHEVPRVVKFIESRMVVARDRVEGEKGS